MRMDAAKATVSSKASSPVPAWRMTSAVGIFQMSLAKWRARNFSGRPVYSAKVLGSRVEELVTMKVFSGRCFCSSV